MVDNKLTLSGADALREFSVLQHLRNHVGQRFGVVLGNDGDVLTRPELEARKVIRPDNRHDRHAGCHYLKR